MPQLIHTIDHIARIHQRDVLMLSFYDRALKERLDAAPPDNQFEAKQQWMDHHLDLPYDKDLPLYQALEVYLQYLDERMRFDKTRRSFTCR